jgi:hypothetical protein
MQIQSAFLEDAGLSLTLTAAQRRFGIDAFVGTGVLSALVAARVIRSRDAVYRRNVPRRVARPAA